MAHWTRLREGGLCHFHLIYLLAGYTDRALGSIASNSYGDVDYRVQIRNMTGLTLTSFTASYYGEQWRAGGPMTYEELTCSYLLDGGTWQPLDALTFIGPQIGGPTALNGNLAANRRHLTQTISGISWQPGQDLWIDWHDTNDPYDDHGLAIDNFHFVAN